MRQEQGKELTLALILSHICGSDLGTFDTIEKTLAGKELRLRLTLCLQLIYRLN